MKQLAFYIVFSSIKKIFFKHLFIFERQRETEHMTGRGRERGRHRTQSRLQTLGCQPRARRGAWIHGPWDHDLSWSPVVNWLSHPGGPVFSSGLRSVFYFAFFHVNSLIHILKITMVKNSILTSSPCTTDKWDIWVNGEIYPSSKDTSTIPQSRPLKTYQSLEKV